MISFHVDDDLYVGMIIAGPKIHKCFLDRKGNTLNATLRMIMLTDNKDSFVNKAYKMIAHYPNTTITDFVDSTYWKIDECSEIEISVQFDCLDTDKWQELFEKAFGSYDFIDEYGDISIEHFGFPMSSSDVFVRLFINVNGHQ